MVDLPAPLGPTRPIFSPRKIAADASTKRICGPCCLLIWSRRITARDISPRRSIGELDRQISDDSPPASQGPGPEAVIETQNVSDSRAPRLAPDRVSPRSYAHDHAPAGPRPARPPADRGCFLCTLRVPQPRAWKRAHNRRRARDQWVPAPLYRDRRPGLPADRRRPRHFASLRAAALLAGERGGRARRRRSRGHPGGARAKAGGPRARDARLGADVVTPSASTSTASRPGWRCCSTPWCRGRGCAARPNRGPGRWPSGCSSAC